MPNTGFPRAVLSEVRRIVGPEAVLTNAGELLSFESDGLTTYRATPAGVVFVRDTSELQRVVAALHAAGIPFVPRGAGTGLSGGALADGGVIIELARMNRVLWVDEENRRARVQPGVINAQLGAAVAPHGLMYAPDPSSQTVCTLGGNVAENSGGPHCLKYGVTTNHVVALTVVMPNGELLDLPGPDDPSYDLVGLFVGSEGTLGICAEIEVRLVPQPEAVETLLAHFNEIDDASRAVSAIIAAGIVPAALEMIDGETLKAVEASVYAAGFPIDVAASLIVELDGPETGLNDQADLIDTILLEHGAREVARAESEADRARFWRARKAAFGALGRIGSDLMVQDATVPRSRLPKVLRRVLQIGRKYDVTIANVFHAGDGNLHPNIPFDSRDVELTERVNLASDEIMQVCVAEGGTITGEHGVGVDKRGYMSLIYSDDDQQAMRWVKEVFDPAGLCNPGKILTDVPPRPGGDGAASPRGVTKSDEIAPTVEAELGSDCLVDDPQAFTIDGQPAEAAAAPGSIDELAEVMKLASRMGWAVVPAGQGKWMSAGNRLRRADLVVTTQRMNGAVEHHPDDLLATVPAGVTLELLGKALTTAKQWWPLDAIGGGSMGAVIATSASGPLAAAYGTPRDLVLGLTAVLADGRVVNVGGRVVKNVAGYDMTKLFIGSWGTLGVIASAHLRLHALPQDDRTHIFRAERWAGLAAHAAQICGPGALAPAAVEMLSPAAAEALGLEVGSWALAVRWLGHKSTVQAAAARALDAAAKSGLRSQEVKKRFWAKFTMIEETLEPVLGLRALVPIRATSDLFTLAGGFAGGETPAIVASPLLGRAWILVSAAAYRDAPGDRTWALRLNDLRDAAEASGGSVRVERAPEALRAIAELWGYAGPALRLSEALKDKFDPNGTLKPGFFSGPL